MQQHTYFNYFSALAFLAGYEYAHKIDARFFSFIKNTFFFLRVSQDGRLPKKT
jgi:hypothetical protein